jgi:hypothetical protein
MGMNQLLIVAILGIIVVIGLVGLVVTIRSAPKPSPRLAADPVDGFLFDTKRGFCGHYASAFATLMRAAGIPARVVTGLTLEKRCDQTAHHWVEVWVGDHWMPMCPFYRHCGAVPATHLVFALGDSSLVRGHNVRDLDYSCLAEHHKTATEAPLQRGTWLQRLFRTISLDAPPPDERGLVEFLLLLGELDKQRLYLELGYSSAWDFVRRALVRRQVANQLQNNRHVPHTGRANLKISKLLHPDADCLQPGNEGNLARDRT